MNDQLSKPTSIFGLRLWVVLGVCVGAAIVLLLVLISIWLAYKRSKTKHSSRGPTIPEVSKEIQEIRVEHPRAHHQHHNHHDDCSSQPNGAPLQPDRFPEPEPIPGIERQALLLLPPPSEEDKNNSLLGFNRIQFEIGKNHRISCPERALVRSSSQSRGSGEARPVDQVPTVIPEVSHLGWGHWYTLRDLEDSTNGFADENVIGEGG